MKQKNRRHELSFSFQWDTKNTAKSMVFGKRKAITNAGPNKSSTLPAKKAVHKFVEKSATLVKTVNNSVKNPPINKSEPPNKKVVVDNPPQPTKKLSTTTIDKQTKPIISKLSNRSKFNDKNTVKTTNNPETIENPSNESSQEQTTLKGYIKRKTKKDKELQRQGLQNAPKTNDKEYNLFSVRKQDVYINAPTGKSVSEKFFTTGSFKDFNFHKHLLSNLEKNSFEKPTNVQTKTLPVVCSGANTLVRSQTGSGKTLCYALPIMNVLLGIEPRLKRSDGVQALIVVPTRELAMQTHELFNKINSFQWIVIGHLCGGENRKSEKDRIRKGVHVLIGTPGRLLDHILHTTCLKIDCVRCLVLDEADRLLDMGFRKDIVSIVKALDDKENNSGYNAMNMLKTGNSDTETKKPRQTLMLSATLSEGVSELANFAMKEHTYIDALDMKSNAVLDSYVIPDTVKQEFIITYVKHRLFTLAALLITKCAASNCKIFVFMASTQMVDYHYELFSKYLTKLPVNRGRNHAGNVAFTGEDESDDEDDDEEEMEEIMDARFFKLHGSLDQKERKQVFNDFRAAKKGILICTDVVARGIDVPSADLIVQYNGPQTDEDYLHRVGRTGRAGQKGNAIIFLTHEEQDYIDHLGKHRVFLKKRDAEMFLQKLSVVMEEPNHEQAAIALQKRFESAVAKDKELYKCGCFAYSTWSRFYNTYPVKMRKFFNFKRANLGHYVTSFALRATPTDVARVVRGQVADREIPRLNKKLANHSDIDVESQSESGGGGGDASGAAAHPKKRQLDNKSVALMTPEFASGLEPTKKKRKKK